MKHREIKLTEEIVRIIRKCETCVLSMVDHNNMPYSIPMNFGYSEHVIVLHTAKEGRKLDILKQNPNVCIVFSTDHVLTKQSENVACSYTMKYRSVLAFGKVEFIEDNQEKISALDILMKQYSGNSFTYNEPSLNGVCVIKVNIEKLEARAYGY